VLHTLDFFINNNFIVDLHDNITDIKIFVSKWNWVVFFSQVLWEINLDEIHPSFVEECVFFVSSEEFESAEPSNLIIGKVSRFFQPISFFLLDDFTVFKLNSDSEFCTLGG